MSTRASLLFPEHEVVETQVDGHPPSVSKDPAWDAGQFADEQLRRLVHQVFVPGWPKPARYVAFTAVDRETYISGICLRVGEILASEARERTAVVEADLGEEEFDTGFAVGRNGHGPGGENPASLRNASQQISNRLWLVPPGSFCRDPDDASAAGLERRIAHVRQEFDYAVVHAPPLESSCSASVMGRLCDGVVLVLEAHRTRRAAAQNAREALLGANVRLLGAVLSGRTFPVPEGIYRRL